MQIDQQKIEQAIIEQAVAEVIHQEALHQQVNNAIALRIDEIFKDTAEKQISEAVAKAIETGFERSYCKIDSFGRPVGEPTTIAKELEKLVSGYWNQRVDSEGKPTEDNYRSKGTRAEWLMTKMVAADFQGEMKQHAINLGGTLKDKLRAELHDTVNRILSEIIHVRSLDDQNVNRNDMSTIHPREGGSTGVPR